ncbi:MAG: membrane protein insertion efficiency factor YidD [Opitutales bacterium]
MITRLSSWLALPVVWLVLAYQWTLSPLKRLLFGPNAGCRFYPTCSHYAVGSLRRHGLFKGGWLAIRRIGCCHPFHPGGYDPVPETGTKLARAGRVDTCEDEHCCFQSDSAEASR